MLYEGIITVYTENHNKQIQNADLLIVKADGTYSYH
jgi:arginyl-tRNA synthetase